VLVEKRRHLIMVMDRVMSTRLVGGTVNNERGAYGTGGGFKARQRCQIVGRLKDETWKREGASMRVGEW
jgi:hypothetical protein